MTVYLSPGAIQAATLSLALQDGVTTVVTSRALVREGTTKGRIKIRATRSAFRLFFIFALLAGVVVIESNARGKVGQHCIFMLMSIQTA